MGATRCRPLALSARYTAETTEQTEPEQAASLPALCEKTAFQAVDGNGALRQLSAQTFDVLVTSPNRWILLVDNDKSVHETFREILAGCYRIEKQTASDEASLDIDDLLEPSYHFLFDGESAFDGGEALHQVGCSPQL